MVRLRVGWKAKARTSYRTMNRLSSQRSQSRLLLKLNASACVCPVADFASSCEPSPAAACTGLSSVSPTVSLSPFCLTPFGCSTSSGFWRPLSVESRIVGIPLVTLSMSASAELPFVPEPFGECNGVPVVERTPLVDALSSASFAARVALSCATDSSSWMMVDEALVCESLCAFCWRYSSSITKTALRVFRSSSQPIFDTSRVRSAYALAQVPRRPGAGSRSKAGSAYFKRY